MGAWGWPSVQVEVPFQFSFTRPRVKSRTTSPTKTAMVLRILEIMLGHKISIPASGATPEIDAFLSGGNWLYIPYENLD